MLSKVLLRYGCMEMLRQPSMLLLLIMEVAFLAAFVCSVRIDCIDGRVQTVTMPGIQREDVGVIQNQLLPPVVSLLSNAVVFLFALGMSTISVETLFDPMLPVVLASGIPRAKVFFSRTIGAVVAGGVHLLFFCGAILLALCSKCGEFVTASPLYAGCSMFGEFLVLGGLCSSLAMLTRNNSAVSILAVAVHQVLGPMITVTDRTGCSTLFYMTLAVRGGTLSTLTRNLWLGENPALSPLWIGLGLSALYLVIGGGLFARKDL